MRVETNEASGIVSFIFEGRLDAVSAESVEPAIMEAIVDGGRYLYDLSALAYISSAGLRVLLATTKAIKRHDGRFVMAAPNANIRHILDISGFASLFPLVGTVAEGQRRLTQV